MTLGSKFFCAVCFSESYWEYYRPVVYAFLTNFLLAIVQKHKCPTGPHVLLWYIYHPIRVVNKVITTWLWLLRVLESQHPMMTMLFIPCENIRVSSIMKLTMWWCVKIPWQLSCDTTWIGGIYMLPSNHRQPWLKKVLFLRRVLMHRWCSRLLYDLQ